MRRLIPLLFFFCLIPVSAQEAEETSVQFIELRGDAAQADAELSSLVWYEDTLLLIAENPQLYAEDNSFGSFFTLDKVTILEYLNAENSIALEPQHLPIAAEGLMQVLRENRASFDGFEAAAIRDNRIYLQIEAFTVGIPPMKSYVISGEISLETGIILDSNSLLELPVPTNFSNLSYESLMLSDDSLLAIYEANGQEANPDAFAYRISLETSTITTIPMPNIPYRITDTSAMDETGRFWAINYFYPNEDYLGTEIDTLFAEFGRGASQTQYGGFVERLLQFQYSESAIELLNHAPIQLEMTHESYGRNWEGIARLDDLGLLIVTDKFPQTLFGFVPFD